MSCLVKFARARLSPPFSPLSASHLLLPPLNTTPAVLWFGCLRITAQALLKAKKNNMAKLEVLATFDKVYYHMFRFTINETVTRFF